MNKEVEKMIAKIKSIRDKVDRYYQADWNKLIIDLEKSLIKN